MKQINSRLTPWASTKPHTNFNVQDQNDTPTISINKLEQTVKYYYSYSQDIL